jgi:hypothetical protein
MLTLRTLAIGMATAGVLAALPLTNAQACDDDRFPCPIVTDNSQSDSAEAPRKKANRATRPEEKARAKTERPAGRTPAAAKESTAQTPAADAGSPTSLATRVRQRPLQTRGCAQMPTAPRLARRARAVKARRKSPPAHPWLTECE